MVDFLSNIFGKGKEQGGDTPEVNPELDKSLEGVKEERQKLSEQVEGQEYTAADMLEGVSDEFLADMRELNLTEAEAQAYLTEFKTKAKAKMEALGQTEIEAQIATIEKGLNDPKYFDMDALEEVISSKDNAFAWVIPIAGLFGMDLPEFGEKMTKWADAFKGVPVVGDSLHSFAKSIAKYTGYEAETTEEESEEIEIAEEVQEAMDAFAKKFGGKNTIESGFVSLKQVYELSPAEIKDLAAKGASKKSQYNTIYKAAREALNKEGETFKASVLDIRFEDEDEFTGTDINDIAGAFRDEKIELKADNVREFLNKIKTQQDIARVIEEFNPEAEDENDESEPDEEAQDAA